MATRHSDGVPRTRRRSYGAPAEMDGACAEEPQLKPAKNRRSPLSCRLPGAKSQQPKLSRSASLPKASSSSGSNVTQRAQRPHKSPRPFTQITDILPTVPNLANCFPTLEANVDGLLAELDSFSLCFPAGAPAGGLHYEIRGKESFPDMAEVLQEAFERVGGWSELPEDAGTSWNLVWLIKRPCFKNKEEDAFSLNVWQKVNKFSQTGALTHKDKLKHTVNPFKHLAGLNICPQTYVLPADWQQFEREWLRLDAVKRTPGNDSCNLWILKPVRARAVWHVPLLHELLLSQMACQVRAACGRGIRVISKLSDITPYCKGVLVQKYIEKPLLMQGRKFDLRLYVLVQSLQPMQVFLYQNGFARLASQSYSTDCGELSNRYMHLTNTSIQKTRSQSQWSFRSTANKITLPILWKELEAQGIDTKALWSRIVTVVIKSFWMMGTQHLHPEPMSFELMGFDIMIDAKLQAWLIEINSSPAMSAEGSVDREVKVELLADTIRLLNPAPIDRSKLQEFLTSLQSHSGKKCRRNLPAARFEEAIEGIAGKCRPNDHGPLGNFVQIIPSAEYDTLTVNHKTNKHSKR